MGGREKMSRTKQSVLEPKSDSPTKVHSLKYHKTKSRDSQIKKIAHFKISAIQLKPLGQSFQPNQVQRPKCTISVNTNSQNN